MKNIFTLVLLLISSISFSQKDANYFKGRKKPYSCNDIIKHKDELKGKYQDALPNDFIFSPLNFTKIQQDNVVVKVMRFSITYYPYPSSENGVYFKLQNGEILRFPDVRPSISFSSRGGYSLMASLPLDDDTIAKLKENFIVQYSVGDETIDIEERNIHNLKNLFNCMF